MKEKLSLLAELIKVANADGQIREEEKQFLHAIAMQMGVSPQDFLKIFNENIEFIAPALEADRIVQFQRMVLMMSVDRNASLKEVEMVKKLGVKMGLNPSAILTVLNEMHNYPNNMLPPERLIEIFKTHHN
ncbi:MAG: TerB family tellurite resistance protein [Putridiphycobacter sp.]